MPANDHPSQYRTTNVQTREVGLNKQQTKTVINHYWKMYVLKMLPVNGRKPYNCQYQWSFETAKQLVVESITPRDPLRSLRLVIQSAGDVTQVNQSQSRLTSHTCLQSQCKLRSTRWTTDGFVVNTTTICQQTCSDLDPRLFSSTEWKRSEWLKSESLKIQTRNVGQCPTWWSPCRIWVALSIQRRKVWLTPTTRVSTVTLPRRESRWNLQGCPKLVNRSQQLVGRSLPYSEDMWRKYCCLTVFFSGLSICAFVAKI